MGWSFDGVDYATIADDVALTIPADDFTLCGWFKVASNSGTGFPHILYYGNSGKTIRINVFIANSGIGPANKDTLGFRYIDSAAHDTGVQYISSTLISSITGQWNAWALSYTHSTKTFVLRMYDPVARTAPSVTYVAPVAFSATYLSESLYIGSDYGGASQFSGELAGMAFLSGIAMSADAFVAFGHGSHPTRFSECVWNLPMLRGRYSECWGTAGLAASASGAGVSDADGHPLMPRLFPLNFNAMDDGEQESSDPVIFRPLVLSEGRVRRMRNGETLDATVINAEELTIGGFNVPAPTADNQVLQATGAGVASWTTSVQELTALVVDFITIDGNKIRAAVDVQFESDSDLFFYTTSPGGVITIDAYDTMYWRNPGGGFATIMSLTSATGQLAVSSTTPEAYTKVDIRGANATGNYCNQIHMHTTSNTYGMFAGSYAATNGHITQGGYVWNSNNVIMPRTTIVAGMRFNSGAVDFYTNSSLTPGTSYTLTVISTIDASGMTINGSVKIHADNQSLTLGAGDDASIYYDGANLVVDPDVVGSGGVYIAGRLLLPMGEVNYFSTTGTAISIATVSDGSTNMVLVNPTTTLANDSGFDSPSAGRLRYTGAETRMFHVACTISFAPDSANDVFVIGVAKNGTVLPTSKVLQKVSNAADTNSTAMHVMVSLSTNDYLEAYAGNVTDADDFTIKTLTLFAMGM